MRVTKRLTPAEVKKILCLHFKKHGDDLDGKAVGWTGEISSNSKPEDWFFEIFWDEEVIAIPKKETETK